ncbi:universal stress protein [Demetria terragena]|uniref:universal stress protein n=1 Tax=Demetria terragena TaxID=63959 RepID=UPI0003822F39|nr:universal stress protein [Demetria terragena]
MTLIAGFPFGKDDSSGIELAASLARSAGTDLRVVTVLPARWPTTTAERTDRAMEEWAAEQGAAAVTHATEVLAEQCPDLQSEAAWVSGRSIPSALVDEAQRIGASMIVVGSGRDGAYGHVHLGSTVDRLLHSSPVPVAIAPRGFHAPDGATVSRATCAFRGDRVSWQTLDRTAEICTAVDCALRVVTFAIRGRTMYPPEVGTRVEDDILARWREQAEEAQRVALADLQTRGDLPSRVESTVAQGNSWSAAFDRLTWERDEVLVVGSSASSFVERLFLGSSGSKLLRHSPVPVIVVP